MAKLSCLFFLTGRKKKKEVLDFHEKVSSLQTKVQRPMKYPYVGSEAVEVAYEAEDEHEEILSIKRDFSNLDLQASLANSEEIKSPCKNAKLDHSHQLDSVNYHDNVADMSQGGHVSDPGIGKAEFWGSPKLKRSCSNLETSNYLRVIHDHLPISRSHSFDELHIYKGSPASAMTNFSADKVMLKRRSSSQILPSRSRKLWWKLFLWSHRPVVLNVGLNQPSGYSSDTLELNQAITKSRKIKSPGLFTQEFSNEQSGLWPQNQWFAFSAEDSHFSRVDEWVKDLEPPLENDDNGDEGIVFPPSPENDRLSRKVTSILDRQLEMNLAEEITYANSVIQSMNLSSTVAHISGIGLKAIPTINGFSSLRSVNLSNNSIVHITPGSLPKGLHTLNLSKNKISTIEGLRDLTRLRALDLCYNRISRIGHGLSNCTLIKELYLAGNKISYVEGLHRLLKLTVLDLSFNKLTTTKTLGQLVANYNSLVALNLLGNPIQINIGDEQLRKTVSGLLPKIIYLNKQPIKPQRAREVITDDIAKAALGKGSLNCHRKAGKKTSLVGSGSASFSRSTRSGIGAAQKNRSGSKSRSRQQLRKATLSPLASSSR